MRRLTRFPPAQSSPFQFTPRMEALDDRIVPTFLNTLANTKADGTQALASSSRSVVSGDGRFVAFDTTSALVAEDVNGFRDVYLKDRSTGAITLVSRATGAAGALGDAAALNASISANGQFVAFQSASNTFGGGNAGTVDIFVRDTVNNTTVLVSQSTTGVSPGAGIASQNASISADGRFVAFESATANFGLGAAGTTDIFLRDIVGNTLELVSLSTGGVAAAGDSVNASVSADGRFVAFQSVATNLGGGGAATQDIFVRDRTAITTTLASKSSVGTAGNADSTEPRISGDGRVVVFQTQSNNLIAGTGAFQNVFAFNTAANTLALVSASAAAAPGGAASDLAAVSGNGRFVAFHSDAANLAGAGSTFGDIFVKDLVGGTVVRLNVSPTGVLADGLSNRPAINRDGTVTTYDSFATNLVSPDGNGVRDVFVNVRPLPALFVAGAAAGGSSQVNVYNAAGVQTASFLAYPPGYTGGVFVARGDVTGDGVEEIVTSTGAGGSANIRVFTQAGVLLNSFFGYPEGFTGGVNVAIGDVNNDGFADIICGVGKGGGPNVRVFSGKDNGTTLLFSFFAYPSAFTGGVRVAAADTNADGFADVICGVGSGGGPNVRVYDGKTALLSNGTSLTLLQSFFALPESFTGGVFISAGDFDNNGVADIAVGVESGGGPNVRAFNAKTLAEVASFFGFDQTLTGGVKVASTDLNGDGFDDFVLGTGPGTTNQLKVISGKDKTTNLLAPFAPFGAFTGGVNVG